MALALRVSFPQKCIGCELCVMEAQRQLKKIGLDGALIRIFRNKPTDSDFIDHLIELDPRIDHLDIEEIKKSCPTGVFEIIDLSKDELKS